jgi:hypothetical protein
MCVVKQVPFCSHTIGMQTHGRFCCTYDAVASILQLLQLQH